VLWQINAIRGRLAEVTLDDAADAHNDLDRVLSKAETLASGFYHLPEDTDEQVHELVTDIETARDEVMDQLIDRGYETGRKVSELVDGDIVPRLEAALDRVQQTYLREKGGKQNPSRKSADPFAAVRRAIEKEVLRYADEGGPFRWIPLQRAAYKVYNNHLTVTGEQLPVGAVHAEIVAAEERARLLRRERSKEELHRLKDEEREEARKRYPSLYGNPSASQRR
jgi:hypothetical protein